MFWIVVFKILCIHFLADDDSSCDFLLSYMIFKHTCNRAVQTHFLHVNILKERPSVNTGFNMINQTSSIDSYIVIKYPNQRKHVTVPLLSHFKLFCKRNLL
jgi:hypothetical protein